MKTLVVGAGALGGYLGACLLRGGRDCTLLVREKRLAQLSEHGLSLRPPNDSFTVTPRAVLAGGLSGQADLVLVTVKSYALTEAMEHFAPAVGRNTAIVPVQNGLAHIDALSRRFGVDRVMGGMALISAAMNDKGHVNSSFTTAEIALGEQAGGPSLRGEAIAELFEGSATTIKVSESVMLDMWEKFAFLAGGQAVICLMRATMGDIIAAPGGRALLAEACNEARAVATASGFPPRQSYVERILAIYETPGSPLKGSMLRDIERGAPTEGAHVFGDITARARRYGIPTPILDMAWCHVSAYEAARSRTAG